jgi:hypothetical protein
MTPTPRGMQMRLPLATRMVTKDMLFIPLFIPLPYSMTTGFQFLIQWKGTRILSLTGFGRDPITSPYSPPLLHVTLQEIGIAVFLFHIGRTPNCWRTLHSPFDWMTGILLDPTAGICLLFCTPLMLNALWGAGLRLDSRNWTAIL